MLDSCAVIFATTSVPLMDRLVTFVPTAALIVGLTAAVAWLVWRSSVRIRHNAGPLNARWLVSPAAGGREPFFWLVGLIFLVLFFDGAGYRSGFFRQDDFSFLQVARESRSLAEQLLLYHSDHTLPLFRLQVWLLVSAAGPSATPTQLAAWFNAANFLTHLAVLLSFAWLLTEWSARRVVVAGACVLLWTWPSWGEFTAGFYILWIYPQTLALGLAAMAAWRRGSRRHNPVWIVVSLVLAAFAVSLGVAGIWILPVLAGVAWLHRADWPPRHFMLATASLVVLGLTTVLFYTKLTDHPYSERERVQNPRGVRMHGRLGTTLHDHGWQLPFGVASAAGGAVLSGLTPTVLKGFSKVVSDRPTVARSVIVAECILATLLFLALWLTLRRWSRAEQGIVISATLPFFAITGLTLVARPGLLDMPASLWAAKYQCISYASAVLTLAVILDRCRFSDLPRARRSLCLMLVAVPLLAGSTHLIYRFERAVNIVYPWFPGGRPANVYFAEKRRNDHALFLTDLGRLSAVVGRPSFALPEATGDHAAYGYLEIGGHPILGSNYRISDLLAASPGTTLRLQFIPPADADPQALAALNEVPSLRSLFLATKQPLPSL